MQTFWLVGKGTKPMTEETERKWLKTLEVEVEDYVKETRTKSIKVGAFE